MELFTGALILSIWHSILFWNKTIGISGILFAIPLVYITIRLLEGKIENKKALLLSIPIILLSSTYLIFNNPIFNSLNIVVIPILYVIMIMLATKQNLKTKSIIKKIILMIIEPLNYFGEVLAKFKKTTMREINIEKQENRERQSIVKPIILTILIVGFVLSLLVSADNEFSKIFSGMMLNIGRLSIPTLVLRIAMIILMFFYISGFFINVLSKYNVLNETEEEIVKNKESLTIRMITTVLNILYLVFCYTQIKSLLTIENIKYSYYARQGFFQLMVVSLINIIVILKATNKELKETEKQKRYKKVMCIIVVVFTLIIIISSLIRMNLYQQQYGDTRLRILVDFVLITEIILLIPTVIYIINSKINLAKSYLIITTTMYCIINFANIDYMIAKNNIDRYIETGKIDIAYLTYGLGGTDTIDQLMRLRDTEFKYTKESKYPGESKDQLRLLNSYLYSKSKELKRKTTFPESNFSKMRANKILKYIKY